MGPLVPMVQHKQKGIEAHMGTALCTAVSILCALACPGSISFSLALPCQQAGGPLATLQTKQLTQLNMLGIL